MTPEAASGIATMVGILGWLFLILMIAVGVALTVFLAVATRFLLHRMRYGALTVQDHETHRENSQPTRWSERGLTHPALPHHKASPVPPENPHSGPTSTSRAR
jgi:hypothetical protein